MTNISNEGQGRLPASRTVDMDSGVRRGDSPAKGSAEGDSSDPERLEGMGEPVEDIPECQNQARNGTSLFQISSVAVFPPLPGCYTSHPSRFSPEQPREG